MKLNKSNLLILFLLIVVCALYRAWESRPMGFAPQIAMALFAGSAIRDRKISFLFPILSMFVSDLLYQFLYAQGLTTLRGFYSGQAINYLLIASITIIGFFINKNKVVHILAGSLVGAIYFFLASNFTVWIGGGLDINNLPYERSLNGLLLCYAEAIPFFSWSLAATLIFNGLFFGYYHLVAKKFSADHVQAAR